MKSLNNGLLVAYVIDTGDHLQHVQYRRLDASGLEENELNIHSVRNLMTLAQEKVRIIRTGEVFAAILDGNFEASLILLDDLWDKNFVRTATGGYVAAIPARDILTFCDPASPEGIAQLRPVVARTNEGGDHLLTPLLYRRDRKKWIQYED